MMYLALKHTHVTCVILTIVLFAGRSGAQLAGYDWRRWKILKILPHVIDTALLGSAIALAVIIHQYPFVHGWLTMKVLALVAYVVLGHLALDPKRPRPARAAFTFAALAVIGYIIWVALTKRPY